MKVLGATAISLQHPDIELVPGECRNLARIQRERVGKRQLRSSSTAAAV